MLLLKRTLRARAEELSASLPLSSLLTFSMALWLMLLLRSSPTVLLFLFLLTKALSRSMLCTARQQESHPAVKVGSRSKNVR